MCEVLVDDFSLLNAHLDDAKLSILGSDSGFDLGNPEPVHRAIESFLRGDSIVRTDDWTGRGQTFPIEVEGLNHAALADMAARVDLVLRSRPRVLTVIPCDPSGAPSQWRIQHARMEAITDDFRFKKQGIHRYDVKIGVSSWAYSPEIYTAVADPNVAPEVVYDVDVDLDTGWAASGGTPTYVAGDYVGVSGAAMVGPELGWSAPSMFDPSPFNLITLEWSATFGSVQPVITNLLHQAVSGDRVSRVNQGSGWYADTFLIAPGAPALDGWVIKATGSGATTYFRVRKITASSGALPGPVQDLWFDIPGSAPAAEAAVTLTGDVNGGLLLYTFPNLPETTEMPVVLAGSLASSVWTSSTSVGKVWPEGNYHLLISFTTTGDVTALNWEVKGKVHAGSDVIQSGTVYTADMPTGATSGDRFVTLATNIYLPAQAIPTGELADVSVRITETGSGSISAVRRVLLLWQGNPLTGEMSPAYTNIIPTGSGGPAWTIIRAQQPTAERPIPSLLMGVDEASLYQESRAILAFGHHETPPGLFRVMAIQAGNAVSSEVTIEWSGKPGWHTHAVPSRRWRQTP